MKNAILNTLSALTGVSGWQAIIYLIIFAFILSLWIWVVGDILSRKDLSILQKITWIFAVIFGTVCGLLLYGICGRPRGVQN
jgi:hypothetical protein